MPIASLCIVLLVLWTLTGYSAISLPISDPFFSWIRRQWLLEGIAGLSCLAVLAVAARPEAKDKGGHPRVPWWRPWAVWLLVGALSTVYSIDRGQSLRGALAFLSYTLLAYAVIAVCGSERQVRTWTRFLVLVAVVVGLGGLIQYVSTFRSTAALLEQLVGSGELEIQGWSGSVIRDFLVRKRIFSVFGWPNLFAGFLLLTLPLAVSLSGSAPARPARIAWGAAALLLGTCLALTLSLGAWLAAVLTAAIVWWLWGSATDKRLPERGARRPLRVALAVGLFLCIVVVGTSLIVSRRAKPFILSSMSSRLVYVLGALNVIRHQPVLGTGLGTFGLSYWALMPAPFAGQAHSALHAHNTVLEVGAELGLLGLLCFGYFLRRVWQLIAGVLRSAPGGSICSVPRGLAIGVLGFFLHSLLEQTFFEAVTAPFWWIGLGLLTAAAGQAQAMRAKGERLPQRPLAPSAVPTISAEGLPYGPAPFQRVGTGPPGTVRVLSPVWFGSSSWNGARLLSPLSGVGLLLAGILFIGDYVAAQAARSDLEGRMQEAIAGFESAQRWNRLEHRYPLELGVRLMRQQPETADSGAARINLAAAAFERSVRLSPWLGYAWLRLGEAQWMLGHLPSAILAAEEAVRKDPNSGAALANLAAFYSTTKRHRDARTIARKLQHLEPSSPAGYVWEAMSWHAEGRMEQALAGYLSIMERFPREPAVLLQLARLFRERGVFGEAAYYYERFLRAAGEREEVARQEAQRFLESGPSGTP